MNREKTLILILFSAHLAIGSIAFAAGQAGKLYWFIPDGMRAEEHLITVYQWAQEGKLPNIKKMMEQGSYGYSIPDFPSHTPTNFASLLTGSHPIVHGVADGPMHVEGQPLNQVSVNGFSSVAKKVSPIWKILEEAGKKVFLLSVPGSTPPELKKGFTVRGRWSQWGSDTPAMIYEPKEKLKERKAYGRGFKLFYSLFNLTAFVDIVPATLAKQSAKQYPPGAWLNDPQSFSDPQEMTLYAYGKNFYCYMSDSTNDKKVNYDTITISEDKSKVLATLKQGVWSDWVPIELTVKETRFSSQVKFKVIKLDESGAFRVRLFFNNINRFLVDPPEVADELTEGVGPMVDFVDNWPPQLIYEDEDKGTFLEEADLSLDWHRKAVGFIYDNYRPDVFIQDIYTPNQMLESRWWHRYINKEHKDYDPQKSAEAMRDILSMYQKLDLIIGEAIKKADDATLIVLSSDHGIAGLRKQVKLNNLFAKKGWFKFEVDKVTGEPTINWKETRVVSLRMAHVYINPNGLGGNWVRGSGAEYESLRNEVIKAIEELKDEEGIHPLVRAVKWEDAPKFFELPPDRVGDIVLEVKKGYQWVQEPDDSLSLFVEPLTSGYKQANNPKDPDMWTPFIIMGPGVKKGYMIEKPISHIAQMPTILKLMAIKIPDYVQGKVLTEILAEK